MGDKKPTLAKRYTVRQAMEAEPGVVAGVYDGPTDVLANQRAIVEGYKPGGRRAKLVEAVTTASKAMLGAEEG